MTIALNNSISTVLRELTDADLVCRASDGDVDAFDCLVLRYRANVLYTARACLKDWDQAEDVAQQALIEAYKSLSTLRTGASFKAWLLTITRRCASRYRASQPNAIELTEAVICSFAAPITYIGIDEVTENVRASLSELSARSRQVVTLHYLDGYSCKEIGSRLNLPVGTVKRILHESRNSLRNRIGITKGAIGQMEVKSKTKGPRRLVWWISGDWPGDMLSSLISQSIVLTVNKKAHTIAEIAKAIDANAAFVEEALRPLIREELIIKNGQKYSTNFIALDAQDWIEVSKETRSQAAKLALSYEPHIPALIKAWEKTSYPAQGFSAWDSLWLMLAALVGSDGISRCRWRAAQGRPGPVHAGSGKAYWAAAREEVSPEHVMWMNGLAIGDAPNFDHFFWSGYIWSHGLNRAYAGHNSERSIVMGAIAWGATDITAIANTAKLSINKTREIIANAIEWGLISRQGDNFSLTFPVFDQEANDILLPTVDAVSSQIWNEFLKPATANVTEIFSALGYDHLSEQFEAWQWWLICNIVGESLRELVSRGVIPDPGECATANFAMFGWKAWVPIVMSSVPD